ISAEQVSSRCVCDVYLVDDGCQDGTADAVRSLFPAVRVIEGTGDLYWCGGMRRAWAAASKDDYDGSLWLNDDVALRPDALEVLLSTLGAGEECERRRGIVVGSTCSEETAGKITTTYGALGDRGAEPPGEHARRIRLFNGNIVLVSRDAHRILGNLSAAYTHGLGDIDYGIRASRMGVPVRLAPGHQGVCAANPTPRWRRPDLSLWTRLYELHRPTGCPPWQLARLLWSDGGWYWPWSVLKLYFDALFPRRRQ
ncbi:MAG: glycosyltransferase family 2 protein, partial [Planctomycetia bacterium]